MNKMAQVSQLTNELASLHTHKADLLKQLAKSYRMREVWPDCFGLEGKAEMFTTSLGGTGNVPFVMRFWLERTEDKVKMELTEKQWDYIKGEKL